MQKQKVIRQHDVDMYMGNANVQRHEVYDFRPFQLNLPVSLKCKGRLGSGAGPGILDNIFRVYIGVPRLPGM